MDLMTMIAACSLTKDHALVLAMIVAFSQGDVLTVKDGREFVHAVLDEALGEEGPAPETHAPRTRAEALAKLERLQHDDAVTVIGLLPVPPDWAAQFQRTTEELFDPCVNVSVATAVLAQFEHECRGRSQRACVLRRYSSTAGLVGYSPLVLDAIRNHGLSSRRSVPIKAAELFSTPIYTIATSERNWGADQLLFHSASPDPEPIRPGEASLSENSK